MFHTPSRSHSALYPTMPVISVASFAPGSSLVGHSCLVSLQFHISLWGIASFMELYSKVRKIQKVDKGMARMVSRILRHKSKVLELSEPASDFGDPLVQYFTLGWTLEQKSCPNRSLLTLLKSISSTSDRLKVASSFAIKFEGKYIVSCL